MRREPNLVLSETFALLTELLRREGSHQRIAREILFDRLLDSYDGYDIIEVICREAAVWTGYDSIENITVEPPKFENYLEHVLAAARKYAASEEWPRFETGRAEAFGNYIRSL